MNYEINNHIYNVIISRKNNKNTYIRVKDNNVILVTTHYLTTKSLVKKILDNNIEYLKKTTEKRLQQQEKENDFYYLGTKYNIVIVPTIKQLEIDDNRIYVKDIKQLEKWYKKQIIDIFTQRLNYNYQLFQENIPFPILKTRTMKTRWGVCNRKNLSVTLNTKLIKMDMDKIDYVIIHELSHLVHFDHSKSFWQCVEKYCPNYKQIRKEIKE